jgi:hypothetical protein
MHSNPSCNKVKRPRSQRNRSDPDWQYGSSMGVVRMSSRAILAADTAAATTLCFVARQAALAKPGEVAPDARDAFESEWLNRLASNVRDRFVHRIGRVDEA